MVMMGCGIFGIIEKVYFEFMQSDQPICVLGTHKIESCWHKKQEVLIGMDEHKERIQVRVAYKTDRLKLKPIIRENVADDAVIMTDEMGAYSGLNNFHEHKVVNPSAGEYVRGDVHTN